MNTADIFKEANQRDDTADSGGHEFTFEEYKVRMSMFYE